MGTEYRVVPFVASVGQTQGAKEAADQLQLLIESHTAQGMEFVRLESVTTVIAGDSGCFGVGATPSQLTSFSMAVFRK